MTSVEVYQDEALPRLVGEAHFTRSRGRLSTTFLYSPSYLAAGGRNIDPALHLVAGAQHLPRLLPAFADAAPDRWGRNLILKAERTAAREQGRAPRTLDELDFLLGVSDDTRQGALRFKLVGDDAFLGPPAKVPRLVALPELLRASDELDREHEPRNALKRLLDTGTTGLGGARPKASVLLDDGRLALAKFPHSADEWDVMAWEATALDLLDAIGVATPKRRLLRVGDRTVLLLRRFDRRADGTRRAYLSALSAVEAVDGQQRDYLDVADALRDLSASPKQDLADLFDRTVANVALGNTDDHLRNLGLLGSGNAWRLSPAFDVNPNPDLNRARATSILGADTFPSEADALTAFADACGLDASNAHERITAIAGRLSGWQATARANHVSEQELPLMAEAIEPRLSRLLLVGRGG